MKQIFLLSLMVLPFSSVHAQEMKYEGGKVYIDNVQITTGMAKDRSMTVSMDAYTSFKKAGRIRGWNGFWVIFGGYELGSGVINTANGYSIGIIDVVVGGISLGIIPGREIKRRMWIADGVKKYNEALAKKQ
jgi:hypothetical protein